MDYLSINSILIIKTNIRSCDELNEVYIRYIFNNYFGKDCINSIIFPDSVNKFPVLIEFKNVMIDKTLKRETIDRIYEFNRYFWITRLRGDSIDVRPRSSSCIQT